MAEYVVCTTTEMSKKPKSISFAEAASIPLVGLTALQVLRAGGVKEGSKVFIPGGQEESVLLPFKLPRRC